MADLFNACPYKYVLFYLFCSLYIIIKSFSPGCILKVNANHFFQVCYCYVIIYSLLFNLCCWYGLFWPISNNWHICSISIFHFVGMEAVVADAQSSNKIFNLSINSDWLKSSCAERCSLFDSVNIIHIVTIFLAFVWDQKHDVLSLIPGYQAPNREQREHLFYWWNWWKHCRSSSNWDVCSLTNWHFVLGSWFVPLLFSCSFSRIYENFQVTSPHSIWMSAWSSVIEMFLLD